MNKKNIIYILIFSIISFTTGWYLNNSSQKTVDKLKTTPIEEKKEVFSKTKNLKDSIAEEITDTENKELTDLNKDDIDYSKKISGRFILKGAEYAGYNFISSKKVLWTNELFPYEPETFKIKWIDKKTFITRITKDQKGSLWICQVVSYDGNRLVLNNISTSWDYYKDEKLEFYKTENEDL